MNEYFFVFFIFSVLIFFITLLIISTDGLKDKLKFLKIIKIISIISPTILSLIIVMFLFNNINSIIKNADTIKMDSIIINSGLSIFGILASVWIGLNIYNTVEKKEINAIIENSRKEIKDITVKLEDLAKIQIEAIIAGSQENINEKTIRYNNIVNNYNNYDLAYILRANYMHKMKKYKEAISDYDSALFKNSSNKYLYYDRGKCNYEIGDYNSAINDFTNAIDSDLYLINSTINRAMAYSRLGIYDKAIRDYTKVIDLMYADDNVYFQRGICYIKIKDYDNAIYDFDMAIKLSKKDIKRYYYDRLYANMAKNNYLEIIHDIDTINYKFEVDYKLYLLRGDTNTYLGNLKEAEFDYKLYKQHKQHKNEEDVISDDIIDEELCECSD